MMQIGNVKLLALARSLAAAAESIAEANHLAVTSCVIDQHGNIVLKQRTDGATLISIEMVGKESPHFGGAANAHIRHDGAGAARKFAVSADFGGRRTLHGAQWRHPTLV